MITITASDGHVFDAYFVRAQGIHRGAIVLIQEIFGVTTQLQSVADRFAEAGFDVIVPALFDRVSPGTVVPFSDAQQGLAIVAKCDTNQILLDLQGAISTLAQPKVSVVGFCWGGGLAMLAASQLALHRGVAFYGTRLNNYLNSPPKCRFQFHFAELDAHSPTSLIDLIESTLPSSQCHVYSGVDHAFANAFKATFNAQAADLAMQRTMDFLSEE